ncbi:MAG: ATP-grasp fold amidoligase family protein, partial [Culicoidibacterales bacterium]
GKFVLKATHGCGYNIICHDKSTFDVEKVKKQLNTWLNQQYGYEFCELHYTKMKPRIICEEFLEDTVYDNLVDYKIYCFNGTPLYILVCLEREKGLKKVFYNLNWEKVNLRKDNAELEIEKPICFEEMIEYAKKLSNPFPFVRVDFYNVKGKPVLGELTFTPAAGLSTEYTEEAELFLGELIDLNR